MYELNYSAQWSSQLFLVLDEIVQIDVVNFIEITLQLVLMGMECLHIIFYSTIRSAYLQEIVGRS